MSRSKKLSSLLSVLKSLEGHADPGPRHFAEIIRAEVELFERITKVSRKKGAEGVREILATEESPFTVGGVDVYGGGPDRWSFYLWACLFPEKFAWNQKALLGDPGFLLKEGETIGEREKSIILGLLTSPYGRGVIFEKVIRGIRERFGNQPSWPEDIAETMATLLGSLSVCAAPICGEMFLAERRGQKFCSDACRKRAHAVPSTERKDPTSARSYFWRKCNEGFSYKDAWEMTRSRPKHKEALKRVGLDEPNPPTSWAKQERK